MNNQIDCPRPHDPGTSKSDPSVGTNPPGTAGQSTVTGYDPFGLYIDATAGNAAISAVYVPDNTIQSQSQYFLSPSFGMPSIDIGGTGARRRRP